MPASPAPETPSLVDAVVSEIARARRDPSRAEACGTSLVVAIDGRSGSGKTHLALALRHALVDGGAGVGLVHMDHLYAGWRGLAAAPTRLREQVLEPLCRAGSAAYRPWDWHADGWGEPLTLGPCELLLVEGCGSAAAPARALEGVRVWLEAPTPTRRERALARDGDTFAPHWDAWAAQEEALLALDHPPEHAHLVLRSAGA